MALKHWIIGGTLAATTVASAIWGLPRTVGGVGKVLWNGVVSQPAQPQEYTSMSYTLKNGNKIKFAVPDESVPSLVNFLATRQGDADEIGLELIAADADDTSVDGVLSRDGVSKLAQGYFTNRAKEYKAGNMPMQEIFQNVKPSYVAPTMPSAPGSYKFEKK